MKKKTIALVATCLASVAIGWTSTVTSLPEPQAPHEVEVTPSTTFEWTEDSLPPELYLWNGDLRRAPAAAAPGHRNCWMSVADTTLVMCPDGFWTYS